MNGVVRNDRGGRVETVVHTAVITGSGISLKILEQNEDLIAAIGT